MTWIIEYHNGTGWNTVGRRNTLAEAEAEVTLRVRVWKSSRQAFSIKPFLQ